MTSLFLPAFRALRPRRCAAALLCALLPLAPARAATPALSLHCSTNQVGRYQRLDFFLEVSGQFVHPFDPEEVEIDVHLTDSQGTSLSVPAFFFQDYERRRLGAGGQERDWFYPRGLPGWRARFAPMATGAYKAFATLKSRQGSASSKPVKFVCLPSPSPGFVRVSRKDPRFLEFSEGQAFFPLGQNLAFIGDQQYVTLSKAESIFGKLGGAGANYLRIWSCCEDWAMAIEARKSAWGRSWESPLALDLTNDADTNSPKCLKMSSGAPRLKLNPSHPVALRPGTRYTLSGNIRSEASTALRLENRLFKTAPRLESSSPGAWKDFQFEFETGPDDYWLGESTFGLEGPGTAWLGEISLRESAGGPELLWEAALNRPVRGFYNPLDCFWLDELVLAAERNRLYLQLCLLTRDLYMSALKDAAAPRYEEAIKQARHFFRYAIARWGYSTSVGAWEYWNEMDPGLPTDRFYDALGEYLAKEDVYRHLRTTSTWGPSAKDCRHPRLDFADVHFYLRPSDKTRLGDEVEAVVERTRWLREQAPNKPAHLGEFGLADDKWRITPPMQNSRELADVHNALWASALSGASGSALGWWWERMDQGNVYPDYRPLSQFVSNIPWNGGQVQPAVLRCSSDRVRAVGLRTGDRAWFWLFNREAAWEKIVLDKQTPGPVSDLEVDLTGLPDGSCQVTWWDTRRGTAVEEKVLKSEKGTLHLVAPEFNRDLACRVEPMRKGR